MIRYVPGRSRSRISAWLTWLTPARSPGRIRVLDGRLSQMPLTQWFRRWVEINASRKRLRNAKWKKATAYLRKGKIVVHPLSETVRYSTVFAEPVIESSEDDPALGEKVLQALAHSKHGDPHPADLWKNIDLPETMRQAFGTKAKTYNGIVRGTRLVGITLDEDKIELMPTRNGGVGDAFLHIPARKILCASTPTAVAQPCAKPSQPA